MIPEWVQFLIPLGMVLTLLIAAVGLLLIVLGYQP